MDKRQAALVLAKLKSPRKEYVAAVSHTHSYIPYFSALQVRRLYPRYEKLEGCLRPHARYSTTLATQATDMIAHMEP